MSDIFRHHFLLTLNFDQIPELEWEIEIRIDPGPMNPETTNQTTHRHTVTPS